MAKVQIKINLALVKGFFSCRIQGRDSVKECICIPKENLYQGKDGALYLDFVGYEDTQQKFGRLYSLKQSFSRAEYLALSEEEKKRIPFCGDIKRLEEQRSAPASAPSAAPAMPKTIDINAGDPDEDLPF